MNNKDAVISGEKTISKVYIILLNWNGWYETLQCLESVFRLNYPVLDVVVCDNGSTDSSVEKICAWAKGNLDLVYYDHTPLNSLIFPPMKKPIPLIENLYDFKNHNESPRLILISTGANLGYSGGINVGLRFVLNVGDLDYAWVLNNDTVVAPDALHALVERVQEVGENVGICGSTIHYFDDPGKVQAFGGIKYNKWLGKTTFLTKTGKERSWIETNMDAVYGASMFVSKKFLETVGLMSEEYFLYYEELDWSLRGHMKGFKSCYAPQSRIFHHGGSSTKASERNSNNKSFNSDYYFLRNRILFTRKFFSFALVTIYLSLMISLFNRIRRGQYDRIKMIYNIIFEKN